MLVISLTAIPPRYGQLDQVLGALATQGADKVVLVIPERYARFDPAPLPALPRGVALLHTPDDLGPAGKLLAPAAACPGADILYCDDDWLYGPGWADAFRAARAPGRVVAGSCWDAARIGRPGGHDCAGVCRRAGRRRGGAAHRAGPDGRWLGRAWPRGLVAAAATAPSGSCLRKPGTKSESLGALLLVEMGGFRSVAAVTSQSRQEFWKLTFDRHGSRASCRVAA